MTEDQILARMQSEFEEQSFADPFQMMSWLQQLAARLLHELGLGSKDAIIAAGEKFWDETLVPYDIPGVGPIVERTIEMALRPLYVNAVKAIADKIAESLQSDNGGDTSTDGGIVAG